MTREEEQSGDLRDVALADEIELVSDLVVAASSSPRHFTTDEVDQLLGVSQEPATGSASTGEPDSGLPAVAGSGAETTTSTHSNAPDGPSLADPAT
jgi:hypothetical protein